MSANLLGLRLFMEGIEVPVISAQISIQPSTPAVASIQIVPTEGALNFLPRTLVHLFTLESFLSEEDLRVMETVNNDDYQSKGLSRIDGLDNQYKCIYSGEVIGINYAKSPESRSVVLQCMDLSSYWDICYQWFADYSVGGDAFTDKVHTFIGANKGEFDNVASGTTWKIERILTSRPRSPEYRNTKGLLGGIIHVMEVIGGIRPRRIKKGSYVDGFKGITDLFTVAEARYNLIGMIGAVEKDTTSAKMYSAKAFSAWMKHGMSSLGNLTTFRDILRQIGEFIFHDVYPNPAGYYKKGSGTTSIELSAGRFLDTPSGAVCGQKISYAYGRLTLASERLGEYAENGRQETWVAAKRLVSEGFNSLEEALVLIGQLSASNKKSIQGDIEQAKTAVFATTVLLSRDGTSTQEYAKKAKDQLETVLEQIRGTLSKKMTSQAGSQTKSVLASDHYYTQLVLPETYFLPPPRCNVIFPDQFYNLSYSRNFLREITRMSCQAGQGFVADGKNSAILGNSYYAPLIRAIDGKNTLQAVWSGRTVILPHEVHSGIIPKLSWITSGMRWGYKASKVKSKDQHFQAGKVGYIERSTHFQFYRDRWSSRSITVDGPLNVYRVIGFPALVIDKPFLSQTTQEHISSLLGRPYLPTQFLGKMHTVTHHINQDGGRTMCVLTHCRTHRGVDDEFLGLLTKEVTIDKTKLYNIDVAKLVSVATYGAGDRRNYLNAVQAVILKKISKNSVFRKGEVIETVEGSTKKYDLKKADAVRIGLTTEGSTQLFPAGATSIKVPRSIKILVKYKLRTNELVKSDTAPEEALRPAWYSDSWRPDYNDGKSGISADVYLPLLGVPSITNDASFTGENLQKLVAGYSEEMGQYADVTFKNESKDQVIDEVQWAVDREGTITQLKFEVGTVQAAIDSLAIMYGYLKSNEFEVQRYTYDYTRRPLASMTDILGSADLVYGDDGEPLSDSMKEGFHSRAFGAYNVEVEVDAETGKLKPGKDAMVGLFKDVQYVPLLNRGKEKVSRVPLNIDPRGRAQQRVKEYRAELEISRGLLGI